jgi:NADH:ubiquinone oxidoreductase subunit K
MLKPKDLEPIVINEKPNYAKVIAITAITVALVEAAVFAAIIITKKIKESKLDKHHHHHHAHDDGFEPVDNADEIHVEFEQ